MIEKRLSFSTLNREVIDKGICAACYGCVSFCTANELNVLTIRGDKPVYANETNCLEDGICYLICPRTTDLDNALETKFQFREPIGSFVAIRNLRTTNPEISEVCCDGGVVTSILKFMLDTKMIDGAVISKMDGLWKNEPVVATKFKDLLCCAGSSLAPSRSISDLGDLTTYDRVLGAFNKSYLLDLKKLAVVGTPCQIQTIRKMQLLRIIPSHIVQFVIGLFCYENFLINDEGKKYIIRKIGTNLDQIEKINLKDDFVIMLKDKRVIHIDLNDLLPITRSACLACVSFSNYTADISVGGLGSPDGYTTTVVRTKDAQKLINRAIGQGYLEEIQQKGVLKKIEKMANQKRKRGIRVLAERISKK